MEWAKTSTFATKHRKIVKRLIIFDWGNTIMRDFPELPGPMCDWLVVEWIPGAQDALEALSKQYPLCIATNAGCSDTQAMRRALHRIDAERYFSWFFSSKDLGIKKPDPRFFLTIAQQCGFSPEQCVMVGDSFENDIKGAATAGFTTVLLSSTDTHNPGAHYVIKHMNQLVNLF
jgi:putative hydrolase of the HAD superfamily